MGWIPLHVHSQYSILDSTCSVKELVKKAKEWQIPAFALTDRGNMYGAVEFYKTCRHNSIKPILGSELFVALTSRLEKKRIPGSYHSYPIVLLVKNAIGYRNLCKLTSSAFIEGFYYHPRIDKEILKEYSEGLICLSGSLRGQLAQLLLDGDEEKANQEIQWYLEIFKEDFYLELQRHEMTREQIIAGELEKESWLIQRYEEYIHQQKQVEEKLLALAKTYAISYVATNDSHYMKQEDWRAHEILLNIQSGEPCEIWERDSRGMAKQRIPNPKRNTYPTHALYFKSPQEMDVLFSDLPESITNTQKIVDKCEFEFDFRTKHYPVFYPPGIDHTHITKKDRKKAAEDYLYQLCKLAIPLRYGKKHLDKIAQNYPDKEPMQVVKDRLEYEFKIIASKEMCDYLLIVYDFIAWAKNNGIPVGPGRGSAAGSIIAYLVGITDIEPLQLHLFFERFINPERISYPDIDVDICMDRRQEVIDYTIEKYGKEKVAQIITFGTMKAKMAIKDVGRVLSVALSKVNAIAKLVPDDLNMTLEKAINIDHDLETFYQTDEEARRIIDMAMKIEGSIRNTSTHAAGLIISAHPITDHVPICIAKDSDMYVTQFSMKPVEAVGMLKIDFLGLKTLTSINKAVQFAQANTNKSIDWTKLPLDDEKTFSLLNQGKTLGVFQLESGGMQELSKKLHIDNFEEIIAVGALYRPGPMDMIPSFINRKHGRESIEIDHPAIKSILDETYGVMVYQEQVMQIASVLAGYSLGEGDVLRRAMGKKDRKEMQRQREKFISGAIAKGIDKQVSENIFEKIEKFASYGFNKSHAAAYAYLTYTTAYLKANYPHEWMAALMTCDRYDLTKVAKFIRDARSMGIAILPPDINEAGVAFIPTKEGIRFAMSGIKGVGEAIVEAIVAERKKNGAFSSLYDFVKRMVDFRIGKKSIELLVDAGALDFTTWSRDALRQSVEPIHNYVVKDVKEKAKGVMNLFSLIEEEEKKFSSPPPITNPSTELELLKKEKELLGFYLTAHPMKIYEKILIQLPITSLREIKQLTNKTAVCTCFDIDDIKTKIANKSQRKFAILSISDEDERFELPIWPELFEEKANILIENTIMVAVLLIDYVEGQLRLQCRYIEDLTKLDERAIKECKEKIDLCKNISKKQNGSSKNSMNRRQRLDIFVDINAIKMSHVLALKNLFRAHPGDDMINIYFKNQSTQVGSLQIDSQWGVQLSQKILDELKSFSFIDQLKYE